MYLNRGQNYNAHSSWSVDIETDAIEAATIYCVVARNMADPTQVVVMETATEWSAWYDPSYTLIGHNFITFDAPVLNRLWGAGIRMSTVVDTLVLSQLYNPRLPRPAGYKGKGGPHSLECWGYRLGEAKQDFHDFSKYTQQMLDYCIQDTMVCLKIYHAVSEKLLELETSELSCQIEHRFRWLVDMQEKAGFEFDSLRANMFYLSLRSEQYKLEAEIHKNFPPELVVAGEYDYRVKKDGEPVASFLRHKENSPKLVFNKSGTKYRTYAWKSFNIGSPSQRAERLLGMGWVPTSKTPTGAPKVDEESVLAFAETEGNEHVGLIADWLVCNGRANMVKTWLAARSKTDGRIHGTVMSCGAGTRRCTHSSPNTANVPSVEARYGKTARSLWTARPDRVLVGADASGLEGRVLIHYLGSKEAEEFMLNDPHTANCTAISEAIGTPISRSQTKNLFYARLYGASDAKLGSMVGQSKRTGTLIREAIDGNIPRFSELVSDTDKEFKTKGARLRCVDGGTVLCPSPHSALNYKFQSAGAIMMKQALIRFHEKAVHEGLDFLVVGNIHDEWQIDCKKEDAQRIGEVACEAMTQAGIDLNFNIRLDGEFSIGRNWSETH